MTSWTLESRTSPLGLKGTVSDQTNGNLGWNITSPTQAYFEYGSVGTIPLIGDWDGNGIDGIGVYQPSTSTFFLKYTAGSGIADQTLQRGAVGSTPITWYNPNSMSDMIGVIYNNYVYLLKGYENIASYEFPEAENKITCYSPTVKQCTLNFDPTKGNIRFKTTPTESDIYIDNSNTKSGTSGIYGYFFLWNTSIALHNYTIRKEGYNDRTGQVETIASVMSIVDETLTQTCTTPTCSFTII